MVIISFDPGTKHFAYSVVDINTLKILEIGMMKERITGFNDRKELQQFKNKIKFIIDKYPKKRVQVERFQNRGKFTGEQNEKIGQAIGIIRCLWEKLIQITPLEWKTYFRKNYVTNKIMKSVLKVEYAKLKKSKRKHKPRKLHYRFEAEHLLCSPNKSICEHEFDTLCMNIYYIEKRINKKGLLWKLDDSLIRRKST